MNETLSKIDIDNKPLETNQKPAGGFLIAHFNSRGQTVGAR